MLIYPSRIRGPGQALRRAYLWNQMSSHCKNALKKTDMCAMGKETVEPLIVDVLGRAHQDWSVMKSVNFHLIIMSSRSQ